MTAYGSNINQNSMKMTQKSFSVQMLALCVSSLMFASAAVAAETSQPAAATATLPVIKVYAQPSQLLDSNGIKLSAEQLAQNGATDMASIVKYLPLVTAPKAMSGSGNAWDSSGTSGYNIRGVDGNRVGIDVDGVDLAPSAPRPDSYQTNTSGVGRDFIDPEMFSQVDIYSGTMGADTDGIGGRVSFKTKSPEDYLDEDKNIYGAYKAGYASANDAWLNSVTAAAGNEQVQALVSYAHRQGKETKSEGKLKENPVDWNSDAVLSRILWNITPEQQLGFTFDYYQRDTDRFIDKDTLGSLYPLGGNQTEAAERTRYALDYRLNQSTALFDQFKTQLYYQKTINESQLNAFYDGRDKHNRQINNDFESAIWGLNAEAKKSIANHEINYGLGASRTEDQRPWVEQNLTTPSAKTQNRMVDTDSDRYFAFINDQMTFNLLGRNLKVTPGLRYEYHDIKPKNSSEIFANTDKQSHIQARDTDYFAPSLGLSYQLGQNYLSYFNYRRGVRVPTAAEMMGTFEPGAYYSVLGNNQLKEESSDAFELGFKTKPVKGLSVDLNGFYSKYKDFIGYKVLDSKVGDDEWFTLQLQNTSNVDIWGGEIAANLNLGEFFTASEGYSISLAAGKTKASGRNADGSKAAVNSIQPAKATLGLNYDSPDQVYGLSFKTTAVDDQTAQEDRVKIPGGRPEAPYQRVAGYVYSDLSAYWNINKFATLNVGLNNVFDHKYNDYAKAGLLTKDNLIDRATETGRNVVASIEFKY